MLGNAKRWAPVGALTTLLLISTVQAGEGARGTQAQERGASGNFSLQAMMHQSTAQFPQLPGVRPWNGRSRDSVFAYRSIPCSGNAPVNNISSNLPSYNGRVRDSRVPSSTRLHPFRFRARRVGRFVLMTGRTTLTVCQQKSGPTPNPDPVSDASKPKIKIVFKARYRRENAEHLRFAGTFDIVGGTERYEDLTGSGTIAGYLFCFAPEGCTGTGGNFLDGQLSMQGTYADPTPQLAAG